MDAKTTQTQINKSFLTKFQKRVLLATLAIPKGEIRTYKQIAIAAGKPRAFRAVGSVMRINPFAPSVPCHRVVRSDGKIGNYSGKGGSRTKEKLLRLEGVTFGLPRRK